jgi:hypothetical protein
MANTLSQALHDNTVQVWDAESGQAIGEPLQGHSGSVLSVAFSPDGKHIVSGSKDSSTTQFECGMQSQARPLESHCKATLAVCYLLHFHLMANTLSQALLTTQFECGMQSQARPLESHCKATLAVCPLLHFHLMANTLSQALMTTQFECGMQSQARPLESHCKATLAKCVICCIFT